ncbi:MAG TPA: hypothetical protein VFV50_11745 [Bdellovibrionales bacterium]|nr:hypothetical protein [Bdellovibrionales bacterium]
MKKFCRRLLRFLHFIALKTHRLSLRYPRTVVGLTLVATLVALAGTAKLQMLVSIDDLIDEDFSTYRELKELNEHFDDNGSLYGIIATKDSAPPSKKELCAIKAWLQRISDSPSDINRIMTSFGPSRVFNNDRELRFIPILDPNCANDADERETLSAAMTELSRSPWGVSLTSKNHNDIVLNFLVRKPETAGQYGSINVEAVDEIITSFDHEVASANHNLKPWWTGVAFFQSSLKKGYELTGLVSALMFVLVVILFRLIFGTWKSGLLFLTSYLVTIIWTYGGMGFSGAPIDVLSNALGLLVLVATLEDFLFVCFVAQRYPGRSWRRHFRHLLVPSFFTSLTTAVGFDSLNAGDLDIIRRFGSWSAFAAMAEWFLVFMFLPALMTLFPRLRDFASPKPARWALAIENLRFKSIPRYVALASLALYVVGLAGSRGLVVQDAPHKIFGESHPFRQAMSYIKESRGWITEVSLVFSDPDDDAFNGSVLDELREFSNVRGIESPVAVKSFLTGGVPEHRGVLAKNFYEASPFAKRLISEDETVARAIVFLEDTDIVHVNALRDRVAELCAGKCHVAGTLVSYGEFGDRVLSSFLDSMALSIALVMLILLFLVYAIGQGNAFAILISSIWGPMILLSLFVIFKIPISYITSVFVSLLVGLAGDNAIHYLFANSRQSASSAYKDLGGASILMTFCMIAASTTLFVSVFAPMRTLGLLLVAGFFLTLLGDFWILQALESVRPRLPQFLRRAQPAP